MVFFFLVNGNEQIGLGHIKRCLILANEAKKHSVISYFLTTKNSAVANEFILNEGFELFTLNSSNAGELIQTVKDLAFPQNFVIIIDEDDVAYRTKEFQKKIIENDVRFMHITVDTRGFFMSHYILNQNVIAPSLQYLTEEYTLKMLGTEYFIFDEMAQNIQQKNDLVKREKYNLLLSFGGADPYNLTTKTLLSLSGLGNRIQKVFVIVGPLNNNLTEIKTVAKRLSLDIEVIYNTTKIYDFMKSSDLAICGMGLTFWELALHNVPCISISGSDREENVLDYIANANYCLKLGHGRLMDADSIAEKLNHYFAENSFLEINLKELLKNLNRNGAQLVIKTILENETSD